MRGRMLVKFIGKVKRGNQIMIIPGIVRKYSQVGLQKVVPA